MQISQIGYVPKQIGAYKSSLNKINSVQNRSYNQINELPRTYNSSLSFTRKWQDHQSWGANFDENGNLKTQLFSFDDNQ
ncbi:hypothetical protein IJ670_01705, partial [bacterium]|nr:hypothetical protein [bacterium]